MSGRRYPISAALYRLALSMYPKPFRQRFGHDLMADFQTTRAPRGGEGSLAAALRCWRGTLADLWRSVRVERSGAGRVFSPPPSAASPGPGDVVAPRGALRRSLARTPGRQLLGAADRVAQDVRFALRNLRRSPAVALVIVVTLALGIGLVAAVLSLVDGILLRPLPFHESDRLVRVWTIDTASQDRFVEVSFPDFEVFRTRDVFESVAAFSVVPRTLRDAHGMPTNAVVGRIAGPLFSVVSVAPAVGRDFTSGELAGGERVVLLSHQMWQQRYGGDDAVIGEAVRIEEIAYSIVGVLPPTYSYPADVALWRPFGRQEYQDDDRELFVIGRLEADATPALATAQVGAAATALAAERPATNAGYDAWAQPLHEMVVGDVRASLLLLLGSVGAVLLIACANVASLLLARGSVRAREMSIRGALGAGAARLVRQVLTESMVLALAGGALGLVLGGLLLDVIVSVSPAGTPRIGEVDLDARVALMVFSLTGLAALAFGLPPAWRAAGTNLRAAMGGNDPRVHGSVGTSRLHVTLVGVQIALSTTLVISAALLFTSFRLQLGADRGFDPSGVIVVQFEPPEDAHVDARAYLAEVSPRVEAIAGVASVGFGSTSPTEPWGFSARMLGLGGLPGEPGEADTMPVVRAVTPGYFGSAGTLVLDGRDFSEMDRDGAPLVAIVNRSFVTSGLAGRDAVGFRLTMAGLGGNDGPAEVRIVGVVADAVNALGAPPRPMIYLSGLQVPLDLSRMLVRTAGVPAASIVAEVREAFWSVDDSVALDTELLADTVADSIAAPRFSMTLVVLFSTLSLVLAAVGVYGVVSYSVAARTREIGVRRALGVTSGGIFVWTLRRWAVLTAAGIAVGVIGAVALGGVLARFLYGVEPNDPRVYVTAVVLLGAAALLACLTPALRASRVDPIIALRAD